MFKAFHVFAVLCVANALPTNDATSDASRQKRLIGGTQVMYRGDYPWLVHLESVKRKFFVIPTEYSYCGGTLLSDRWILTAAHCFTGAKQRPDQWHASVGTLKKYGIFDSIKHLAGKLIGKQSWQKVKIHGDKIITHPRFVNEPNYDYDIALLRLRKRVPLSNDYISVVNLPEPGNMTLPLPHQVCTVLGWGCNENNGKISSTVYEAEMQTLPDCRKTWKISGNQFCAGSQGYNKNAVCAGDSGGPLICKTSTRYNAPWQQVGVVSFSSKHDPTEYPGGFMRVAPFIGWIRQVMAEHDD